MSLSSRHVAVASLVLGLACIGCQVPSGPTGERELSVNSGIKPRILAVETAPLTGSVRAPGVVSSGGGNVISSGGGNVISAGGGNVISAGGGNVVSSGGGNWRVLAAAAELPVSGAVVFVRDARTRKLIPWIKPIRTDAEGGFAFPKLPARYNFLLEAVFFGEDGKPRRMIGLARPGRDGAEVNWASTAMTTAILEDAGTTNPSALYLVDVKRMAEMQNKMAGATASIPEDERAELLERMLAAEGDDATFTLEEELTVDGTAGVVKDMAEKAPEVAEALETMDAEMARTEVPDEVVDQASAINTAQEAPPVDDDGRIIVEPAGNTAPAPTPTPTAEPIETRLWAKTQMSVAAAFQTAGYMAVTAGGVAFVDKHQDLLFSISLTGARNAVPTLFPPLSQGLTVDASGRLLTFDTDHHELVLADSFAALRTLRSDFGAPNGLYQTAKGLLAHNDSGVWNIDDGNLPSSLVAMRGIDAAAVSPDGETVLLSTVSSPKKVRIYNTTSKTEIESFTLPVEVTALATDGAHYVALSEEGAAVYAGNLSPFTSPVKVGEHQMPQNVAIHPTHGVVVAADRQLFLYTPQW